MSGRAGRRGLDERGIVILMVDEKMEPSVAQGMVKGQSDVLNSSFHIGYNMLLNLLRVEGIDPTYMLKQSFHQVRTNPFLGSNHSKVTLAAHPGCSIVTCFQVLLLGINFGSSFKMITTYLNLKKKFKC